jgi:predicted GTPase
VAIFPEEDLAALVERLAVRQVVFSYSDVSYTYVMHRAAVANAAGADFVLLGPRATMLDSAIPVVAVCAVRTGAGKSQTSRRIVQLLRNAGLRVAVVGHPMPYGDLSAQRVQRFATVADLKRQHCTIEEMEEYEPHLENGTVVYAGVDYAEILETASRDADIILWDGGNNDLPFYRPTLHVVVADPLRLGNELTCYPGEANLRMAAVVVINKVDTADLTATEALRDHVRAANPDARIVEAASPVMAEGAERLTGRRVLVVEDGPTLTHGDMRFGAGTVLTRKFGAAEIIDPRPFAVGSIADTYNTLPCDWTAAAGDGVRRCADSGARGDDCAGPVRFRHRWHPIDLSRLVKIDKPVVRARYELQEVGRPDLADALAPLLKQLTSAPRVQRPEMRDRAPSSATFLSQ